MKEEDERGGGNISYTGILLHTYSHFPREKGRERERKHLLVWSSMEKFAIKVILCLLMVLQTAKLFKITFLKVNIYQNVSNNNNMRFFP